MVNKVLRIKELCEECGITQQELAKLVGWYTGEHFAISFNQAVKRNKFDIDKLADLVAVFNSVKPEANYTIADLFEPRHNTDFSWPKCGTKLSVNINISEQ